MNEYTRREEVRWTLLSSIALVVCIALALLVLVSTKGERVPDPALVRAAETSQSAAEAYTDCPTQAKKFAEEVAVFRNLANVGRDESDEPTPLEWAAAEPTHKSARALLPCTEAAIEHVPESTKAWAAVRSVARIQAPTGGAEESAAQAETVLLTLEGSPVDETAKAAEQTGHILGKRAETAAEKARTETIVSPLPQGILGRKAATAGGLGIALIALILSFLSVRAASLRRAATLIPLRMAARTSERGHQAAAILRLAAAPNGGEPGMVIGAGIGGLLAALLTRPDADYFVAGVMAGLVVGRLVSAALRMNLPAKAWRRRSKELADIEKPVIPIVLVLGAIQEGMEAQFVEYLGGLDPAAAAKAVDKLAAQAEERILMAADSGSPSGA